MNPRQKQFSLNRGASRKQIPISQVQANYEAEAKAAEEARAVKEAAIKSLIHVPFIGPMVGFVICCSIFLILEKIHFQDSSELTGPIVFILCVGGGFVIGRVAKARYRP